MENIVETVSTAALNYIKLPFSAVVVTFVVLAIITAVLVSRELGKQNDI